MPTSTFSWFESLSASSSTAQEEGSDVEERPTRSRDPPDGSNRRQRGNPRSVRNSRSRDDESPPSYYQSMEDNEEDTSDADNEKILRTATSNSSSKRQSKRQSESASSRDVTALSPSRKTSQRQPSRSLSPAPPQERQLVRMTSFNIPNYRGFSTSIGDLFAHPRHERVDCCAMVCCGIFQSDRDRYLLQGVTPPSPWKRVWVHFGIPVMLFLTAGWAALHIHDIVMNELFVFFFLFLLLGSVLMQCQKGRVKRMDIRKDVLWYKYKLLQHRQDLSLDQILDQHRPYDTAADFYYQGQTHRDIGCSHPYCFMFGCYTNDKPSATTLMASGSNQRAMSTEDTEDSLCSCLFKTFCSPFCGMFLQVGGICGMAQESREIEGTLLPPAYRRLDYITMQPMLAYYEDIYNQRWREFNTFNSHGPEGPKVIGPFTKIATEMPNLSLLSKVILQMWLALTVFLGIWSVIGPIFWTQFLQGEGRRHYFSFGDYIVYMASWLVCFVTLAIVVYFCQRKKPLELSVDAMVKYFASGFVLSTTLSIFYEVIIGLTLRLIMVVIMLFWGIDVVKDNEYNMVWEWVQQPLMSTGFGAADLTASTRAANGEDYLPRFGRDHPIFFSVFLFINSFFLAALVEEICKYFGFRMIEHPDFLTQQDLEDCAQTPGIDDVKEDFDNYDPLAGESRYVDPSLRTTVTADTQVQRQNRRKGYPHHAQSKQSQGSSITVAMVCVALGFSMCEDLFYIFLYNGSSVELEVYVLIARTLFPIHPIAAVMQSIGVCERDVEKRYTKFGRVLLPAILFHGTYDFLLLWIDFMVSLTRSDGYTENDDETLALAGRLGILASYALSAGIMGGALYWFHKESKKQSERLAALDADTTSELLA